ncbi:bis(5'-nucleosyl)-tetraphosphatase [asymmetrical] [Nilaparvata lugens]|uniref:bis(5'-nucleosyl)-tetraphosphatase [asymmetrical] n=1 Tax=Nilaparvata lugens TaxID=108931 RepID=UPI000B999171|nr:bis(5'-nucleosyl)-tetraphosphatase [asymmetrical] [Nilaparvata lugens]XP_022203605.2 bis(5'-nucleosyl)-tetraphosphatase [asymmetrical] [Nilaparvata lugens]
MTEKVTRAAGLLIFRRNPNVEYLLLKASYKPYHWTPPKGHLDPGEDEMQAALRETVEESGLSAESLAIDKKFHKQLVYEAFGKQKTVSYWLAEIVDKNATVKLSSEHQAFEWCTIEKALDKVEYEDTKSLLREAEKYLETSDK